MASSIIPLQFGDEVWGAVIGFVSDGTVKSSQKISDTAGSFTETLADGDSFGAAVANIGDLDNDGVTDLAVGSPFDNDGGADRGAAYILFMKTDGTVKSSQKISDTAGSFTETLDDLDRFGIDVASIGDLDGDGVNDLAVGAFQDDDGNTNRGAVYILFMNTDGTVSSSQKISDTAGSFTATLDDSDFFGVKISNIGDLNNDGINDLAVGANRDDDGGSGGCESNSPPDCDIGAVYILFMKTDGTVSSSQKISDIAGSFTATLDDGDLFGRAVTSIGNLDGDGITDLAVGAIRDDDGNVNGNRGAVYVLFLNGNLIKTDSQGDLTAPSFGIGFAENEYPVTIDNTTFKMSDFASKVDTVTGETGKSIQVKVLVFDEIHSSEIQIVNLLTNLRGSLRTASDSDTGIYFQTGNPPTVIDPNGYFSNVDVSTTVKGGKLEVTFDITFEKEMDTSDIIIQVRDRSNNDVSLQMIEGWKIIKSTTVDEPTVQEEESPSLPEVETPVVPEIVEPMDTVEEIEEAASEFSVPSWLKNSAGWWSDGLLRDDEFVKGIQYLINEEILRIPETEQTGTGSTLEIPGWIKTNAGWWADDLLTDYDFVQGIQWLIANGIMKV